MHVWLDLISRELLFGALLTLLGLAPAAWLLPDRLPRTVRLALCPALGLAVGLCVTTTVLYAFPARETGWPLVVVAVIAGAAGLRRLGASQPRPRLRALAAPALIAVVVLVSFSYPLAARHSVGPIGGYKVADTSGYVIEIATLERYSLRQIDRVKGYTSDLDVRAWAIYAQHDQQFDVAPLEANLNRVLGLGPLDTQSPFLIAIILAGALGAFGVVRSAARDHVWPAVFAGLLFAGPLFAELLMDGSEAAITGAALLAPMAMVGLWALEEPRWRAIALFGLVAAGLQTAYPLFVAPLVIGGGLVLMAAIVARRRRGSIGGHALAMAAGRILVALMLAAVLSPVAFVRNLHYWLSLVNGTLALDYAGLPQYRLGIGVLPGWVLQTREFYGLVSPLRASGGILLGAALLPLVLILLIALGAVRDRLGLVMVAVALGTFLLAGYAAHVQHCSYCVQRNLLPTAALTPTMLGLGLAALAALRPSPAWAAAALVALLALILIGHQGLIERRRLQQGAYVLDPQLRAAAARIPARSGPVELEGFGQMIPLAPMELPLAYNLVDRITGGDVSEPTITDDYNGLSYLSGRAPLGPSFKENYQYVLTRAAGIVTRRPVVARFGPIALQRRVADLDVTLLGGISLATAQADRTGTAWVSGPLAFLVAGGRPGQSAWVSLTFRRTVAVQVAPNPALSGVRRRGDALTVCLRVPGQAPVRLAGVALAFPPQPPPAVTGYAQPLPTRGVRLTAMSVSSRSCAAAG